MSQDNLLEVSGLKTYAFTDEGTVQAVNGADFTVKRGITLGIVGESGCGKSLTALSILNLVTRPVRIVEGQIRFRLDTDQDWLDLAALKPNGYKMRTIRGNHIAMIFQEPMNSLSPVHTIGFQIMQGIRIHNDISKEKARARAIELLHLVGIPDPEARIDNYTFQLSGGMRQRAMIAMALACSPTLLIADEPTTALDVTTQAQILELIQSIQKQYGMSVIIITHDLGVVAETCDEVAVMYLGEVVEQANIDSIFYRPLHPYTEALLRSIPRLGLGREQAPNPIAGSIPDPYNRPTGCPFHPRCRYRIPGKCDQVALKLTQMSDGRTVRCVLYEDESSR